MNSIPLLILMALVLVTWAPLPAAQEPAEGTAEAQATAQPAGDLASTIAALVAANEKNLPLPAAADAGRAAVAHELVELLDHGHVDALAFQEKADEMRRSNKTVSPAVLDAMLLVIREAMRPDLVRAHVERGLANRLDDEALQAGVRWERSAPGQRVAEAFRAASGPGQREAMKRFVEQRLRAPPGDDPRARSCAQIVALTNLSDVFIQAAEAFAGTAMAAMAIDKGQPIDMTSFGQAMAGIRPLLRSFVPQSTLLTCVFVARDLSDADVEAWLAFVRTDAGGRYARGRSAAEVDALVERAGVMFATMRQLAPRLQARPKA